MKPQQINILIACEESQAECTAFRELGFNAFSCDIQPCRKHGGHPEWHIWGDVTEYLQGKTGFVTMDGHLHLLDKWHLIIAHPPCTYICKMGSVQMWKDGVINERRLQLQREAVRFFYTCLAAKADYVAVENPLPQARAGLPKPSFYTSPHWFGVKYSKKTIWWVKDLPPVMPTVIYPNPKCYVKSSRGKYRSRTFPQVAREFAKQWGAYLLEKF